MATLGIIGGLGPMATGVFIKKIINMTDAASDQEHVAMEISHCPAIPDRTKFILHQSDEDPGIKIGELAEKLAASGVAEIAIPCVTAHCFLRSIKKKVNIPFIDGIDETAAYLTKGGYHKVGILGTDGTVHSGFLAGKLTECGIECCFPSKDNQAKLMSVIYDNVKAGKPINKPGFTAICNEMRDMGVELILLACTELSVIADEWLPAGKYLDILDVMAQKSVLDFGKLKKEYEKLEVEINE